MLLIKRICEHQRRPVFEVLEWPRSALEHWSIFFSINDNKDKAIIEKKTAKTITLSQSKNSFREMMS